MVIDDLTPKFEKAKITNFVEAFEYLKNAGYNEMNAFFNARHSFPNKLTPDCLFIKCTKQDNTNLYGYQFVIPITKSEYFKEFVNYCASNGFESNDLCLNSPVMIIEDERLHSFFRQLLIDESDLIVDDVSYNSDAFCIEVFGKESVNMNQPYAFLDGIVGHDDNYGGPYGDHRHADRVEVDDPVEGEEYRHPNRYANRYDDRVDGEGDFGEDCACAYDEDGEEVNDYGDGPF